MILKKGMTAPIPNTTVAIIKITISFSPCWVFLLYLTIARGILLPGKTKIIFI